MKIENSRWIKDGISGLHRVRDSYEDRGGMYRMDRNERTWPIPEPILDEMRRRTDSGILTNYTEIDRTYHKLAGYLGVGYDQVYLHSGSDLVIKSIFETYIGSGDRVMMQNPSYAMYGVYARMYGADIREQDFGKDLSFDLAAYCGQIESLRPKMVILENPGGYIGNSFSHDAVRNLAGAAVRCGSLVVIDEAYIDYIPEASALDLIPEYDNLIIVRTFSKAWGLAGLRAGYAVSNELLISELFKVRPMHELTAFTAMAVEVMLSHADEVLSYVDDVKRVRKYFYGELDRLGIRYAKSDAHFVTACIGEKFDADDFREKAHAGRFYVRRPFGQKMLRDWVRIGLLPMQDMEKFVEFMRRYLGRS